MYKHSNFLPLIILVVLFSVFFPESVEAGLYVRFRAPGLIHYEYYARHLHRSSTTDLKLYLVKPGGAVELLGGSVGGYHTFNVIDDLEGKPGEEYTFRLKETYETRLDGEVVQMTEIREEIYDFPATGQQVLTGTPLFDATVDNCSNDPKEVIGLGNMYVPEDLNLTLKCLTLDNSPPNFCVDGKLNIVSCTFMDLIELGYYFDDWDEDYIAKGSVEIMDSVFKSGLESSWHEYLKISNSTIYSDYRLKAVKLHLLGNLIEENIYSYYPLRASEEMLLRDNEIHGRLRLELNQGTYSLTENVITEELFLEQGVEFSAGKLNVTGNSLLGGVRTDQPLGEILYLNSNFWGSPGGPNGGPYQHNYYLNRGVYLPLNVWDNSPLNEGEFTTTLRPDKRMFPKIYVYYWNYCQNVADFQRSNQPFPVQGKDTLVFFDLRTVAEDLGGIDLIYELIADDTGEVFKPVNDNYVLKGSYDLLSLKEKSNADRTLNFIIPGSYTENHKEFFITLRITTPSDMTDYEPPPAPIELSMSSGPQHKAFNPFNPLKVGFTDVEVHSWGKTHKPDWGNVETVRERFEYDATGQWPLSIPKTLVTKYVGTCTKNWGYWPVNSLSMSAWYRLLSQHRERVNASLNPKEQKYDLMVGVLSSSKSVLVDGVEGLSKPGYFGVAINEMAPTATVHELLHVMGYYTTEQYTWCLWGEDWTDDYKNYIRCGLGAVVEGVTIFNSGGKPDPWYGGAKLPRILHIPSLTPELKKGVGDWGQDVYYDIMSADNEVWTIASTLAMADKGLQKWLGTYMGPRRSERTNDSFVRNGGISENRAADTRRLYLSGVIQKNAEGQPELIPETITSEDASDWAQSSINHDDYLQYRLFTYNARGEETFSSGAFLDYNADLLKEADFDFWHQTFDVSDDTVRIEIYDEFKEKAIWKNKAASNLSLTDVSLADDAVIGDNLEVQWSGGATNGFQDNKYQVLVKFDDQTDWQLAGATIEENLTLDTASWPNSDQISLKIISSDGVKSVDKTINGLKLNRENQKPAVEILSPQDQDRGEAGVGWKLSAQARDPEDGVLQTGAWTSNLDGLLGAGLGLDGVNLSPGNHTISFRVEDSSGAASTAVVNVYSGPIDKVDLALTDDALQILSTTPLGDGQVRENVLNIGEVNHIGVLARNEGIGNQARLTLFITPPGGSETELNQETFNWEPFAEKSLSADYTPQTKGTYKIRATIVCLDMEEADAGNNAKEWDIGNSLPESMAANILVPKQKTVEISIGGHDSDQDALTYTITAQPAHGVLTGTPPYLKYCSDDYTGLDSFKYKTSDGTADSEEATVQLRIYAANASENWPDLTNEYYYDNRQQADADVVVKGANFKDLAEVFLQMPGQAEIKATSASVSSATEINCLFDISKAQVGFWDLKVVNPDGRDDVLPEIFQVIEANPGPRITRVTPNYISKMQPMANMNLEGAYFDFGASVHLLVDGQNPIQADSVAAATTESLMAMFMLFNVPTGIYDVRMTNEDGKTGVLEDAVIVFDPATSPTVTAITPNSGGNDGVVSISALTGTLFKTGASVILKRMGLDDITATNVVVVSSTMITCDINLKGAETGAWDVFVQNPDGGVGFLASGFTVTLPKPEPFAITPGEGVKNTKVAITNLAGTGFRSGATVTLRRTGQSDIPADSVIVVSSQLIACSFNLDGAAIGAWDVVVENDDNQKGTLTGGFEVGYPGPTVGGITPNSGQATGDLAITDLAGANFRAGATVRLIKSGQTAIEAKSVKVVSNAKIECTIGLWGAAAGVWDVVVENDDGKTGTLSPGLDVARPALAVSGIVPDSAYINSQVPGVELSGTGFQPGATARLIGGNGSEFPLGEIQVASALKITGSLDLTGAVSGTYNVSVVNDDGQSAILPGAFQVFDPAPEIKAINPNRGNVFSTVVVTNLSGLNFRSGAFVSLKKQGQEDIRALNVNVVSEDKITCEFNIPDTESGNWDVFVQNEDGQSDTLTSGFKVRGEDEGASVVPILPLLLDE